MTRLLLDTHVFLWWLVDSPRLAQPTRTFIADGANDVLVSAASIWEMAIKSSIGKLRLDKLPVALADLIEFSEFVELPVKAAHAALVRSLPLHHTDPFDRLLVVQAQCEQLTFATADQALGQYEVPIMTAE